MNHSLIAKMVEAVTSSIETHYPKAIETIYLQGYEDSKKSKEPEVAELSEKLVDEFIAALRVYAREIVTEIFKAGFTEGLMINVKQKETKNYDS